jgi:hypothetical protein
MIARAVKEGLGAVFSRISRRIKGIFKDIPGRFCTLRVREVNRGQIVKRLYLC